IGEHGIAVLAQREGLEFEGPVESDSAPLHTLVAAMLTEAPGLPCLRDPTRGGLSSTCNEISAQSGVGMLLVEQAIPFREVVRGACELLGLDPLYVASEGRLVAIAEAGAAERILEVMRGHPLGRQAAIIGTVTKEYPRQVLLRTRL